MEVRLRRRRPRARLLNAGDRVTVGRVTLDVMHTPGHTPEQLSFVVTDTPAGVGPWGVVTGGFGAWRRAGCRSTRR